MGTLLRTLVIAVLACGAISTVRDSACAGGITFATPAEQAANTGPPYFGFVRDRDGNPVPDAKITVNVKSFNWTMILRADSGGHFFVPGFDKSVDPNTVEITCSKAGYKAYAKARLPRRTAAIEIVCILQKL